VAGRAPACKKTEWRGAGVVIYLQRGADLHMAQLMPLPLTVSCFSKIQIGLTFWYQLTQVVPDKRPVNGCVCSCKHEYTRGNYVTANHVPPTQCMIATSHILGITCLLHHVSRKITICHSHLQYLFYFNAYVRITA